MLRKTLLIRSPGRPKAHTTFNRIDSPFLSHHVETSDEYDYDCSSIQSTIPLVLHQHITCSSLTSGIQAFGPQDFRTRDTGPKLPGIDKSGVLIFCFFVFLFRSIQTSASRPLYHTGGTFGAFFEKWRWAWFRQAIPRVGLCPSEGGPTAEVLLTRNWV